MSTKQRKSPERVLRELAAVLARHGDEETIYEVLYALLTGPERERIALRWELVCLLEQGVPQRAVAERLGISLCKITRGSRELKKGPPAFRKIVQEAARRSQITITQG